MPRTYGLILLLAAVTAVGPFSLQALAPALPAIARDLAVPSAEAQTMLSLSLAAMALATLAWGPLSDRFGRRPVMVAGMAIAALGSALAVVAPSLGVALVGRVLQATGAAAGMVLARAVAQDVYGRGGAAGAIGKITAVMVVAPMVAPAVSGVVVETVGWRGIFAIVAVAATGLALACRWRLPETAPAAGGRSVADILRGFAHVGTLPEFWRHAAFSTAILGSFMFFIGIAPYVMEETFGLGPVVYGIYFVQLALAYLVANLACRGLSRRFGGERMLLVGGLICMVGPALAFLLLAAGYVYPTSLFLPAVLHSIGAGLAMPNAMAGAVGAAPARSGAASSLLGFSQFAFAGLAAQAAGFLPHDTALPAVGGMAVLATAALAAHVLIGRLLAPEPLGDEAEADAGRAA